MAENFERVEAEVQREVKSRMCHHYRGSPGSIGYHAVELSQNKNN